MEFSLWIDADSCPIPVRKLIVKFILRLRIPCFFVANRTIPLPTVAQNTDLIQMIVTESTAGAADDYIVEHVQPQDMVITRDIPLAARLVEKEITVINDRGKTFSAESIREEVSIRNFNYKLVQMGMQSERSSTFSKKNLNDFANCLDRELQRKLRK